MFAPEGMKITAIATIAINSIQFMYEAPSSSALFLKKYSVISSSCLSLYSGCSSASIFTSSSSGVRAIEEHSSLFTPSKRHSLGSSACLQWKQNLLFFSISSLSSLSYFYKLFTYSLCWSRDLWAASLFFSFWMRMRYSFESLAAGRGVPLFFSFFMIFFFPYRKV